VELTKYERLNLINQYKILEKLYPDESKDYEVLRKALEEGYVYNYYDSFHWMEDELSEAECREVIEILNMYRDLKFSYGNLLDKEEIEESKLIFRGFDGNYETKQYVYAQYYLFDLDKYLELRQYSKFHDFNTHTEMLGKYRRMLSIWNALNNKCNELTAGEIKKIIKA
jgi:uncharacterized protein